MFIGKVIRCSLVKKPIIQVVVFCKFICRPSIIQYREFYSLSQGEPGEAEELSQLREAR